MATMGIGTAICGAILVLTLALASARATTSVIRSTVPPISTDACDHDRCDAAVQLNRGTAFATTTCPHIQTAGEWKICWPPVEAAIARGECLVYSFGVARYDKFTAHMAAAGCKVFAFDPAANHPRRWMDNVTFYHYGLTTAPKGQVDETAFEGAYGSTSGGKYKSYSEIQAEVGHSASTPITVMKIDCEGCEFELFSQFDSTSVEQILTEFHFSDTLRFDLPKAALTGKVLQTLGGYRSFHFSKNPGYPADRHVDPTFVRAGMAQASCCREAGLISGGLSKDWASPLVTEAAADSADLCPPHSWPHSSSLDKIHCLCDPLHVCAPGKRGRGKCHTGHVRRALKAEAGGAPVSGFDRTWCPNCTCEPGAVLAANKIKWPAGSTGCDLWGCSCQGLSDHLGTGSERWNSARNKPAVQRWWIDHKCTSIPPGN